VDFDVINQLLITDQIFCIRQITGGEIRIQWAVHQLFINFKKAYDSVRKKVLYRVFHLKRNPKQ
jgi:hypothetical protein